jgi:hypothetical protein
MTDVLRCLEKCRCQDDNYSRASKCEIVRTLSVALPTSCRCQQLSVTRSCQKFYDNFRQNHIVHQCVK